MNMNNIFKPIAKSETEHIPKLSENHDDSQQHQKRSTPPESVFIKLAPSRERYSLKLDGEL